MTVREIVLSNATSTFVDEEDYHYLTRWSWQSTTGYATRSERFGPRILDQARTIYMHVVIAKRANKYTEGLEVDHIDRVKLNNRRENLRPATHSLNCANVGLRRNSTSGFTGVTFDRSTGKWLARTPKVNGVYKHVGLFESIRDAIDARERAMKRVSP